MLAIAIASFALLFFEIAIIRILSVVLWYRWAFLAFSLAMLALAAPGVWYQLRPPSGTCSCSSPRTAGSGVLGLSRSTNGCSSTPPSGSASFSTPCSSPACSHSPRSWAEACCT
jgi:hypothetical protein